MDGSERRYPGTMSRHAPRPQRRVEIRLDAVILAVTGGAPRLCAIRSLDRDLALPSGPLELQHDRTLELAARRRVREQTGIELGYVEQLYTFGDRDREATALRQGARVVSVAYLALVREERTPAKSGAPVVWTSLYEVLPWENWLPERPACIDEMILPALRTWVAAAPDERHAAQRRERADICFGADNAPWDGARVLERYELLYEMGLVGERHRDNDTRVERNASLLGREMAVDHRRICATALGRIRGKIRYRPLVFDLLTELFTLWELQQVVEALAGLALHKQNFRRFVERGGLVEGTGRHRARARGRPAELFRFRRDVIRERRAPGIGLPGQR